MDAAIDFMHVGLHCIISFHLFSLIVILLQVTQ